MLANRFTNMCRFKLMIYCGISQLFFNNKKYINEIKQGAPMLQKIFPKIYQIMYKENHQITKYIKNNI